MARILIVEDDADLAGLVTIVLQKSGHEVKSAGDGIVAMNLVRSMKPDLIVLDFMFPAGGGTSFYKRLRMSSQTQGIPILLLTAVPEEQVVQAIGHDAVSAFLSKPYNKDVLLAKVAELLK